MRHVMRMCSVGPCELPAGTRVERQTQPMAPRGSRLRTIASGSCLIAVCAASAAAMAQLAGNRYEETKVLATDGGSNAARFGRSVALYDDLVAVGAPLDVSRCYQCGAAYLYRFDTTDGQVVAWQRLVPDNVLDDYDNFGYSIAVGRPEAGTTTVMVGTPGDADNAPQAGAVYAFTDDDGDGRFTQSAKLLRLHATSNRFGTSVAIDGGICAVGGSGAPVVVFEFDASSGQWLERANLWPDAYQPGEAFGASVSVSETRILVGDPWRDVEGKTDAGLVFSYTRSESGVWELEGTLSSPVPLASQLFGQSVSLSDEAAVVGAPGPATPGEDSGTAHAFRRIEGQWQREEFPSPFDAEPNDRFGIAVSVSGDMAIVGSERDDHSPAQFDAGSAYAYRFDGAQWIETAKLLTSDGYAGDHLGLAVAFGGGFAVCGADDDDLQKNAGAAYLFGLSHLAFVLGVGPLISGQEGVATIQGGVPSARAELLYSLTGTGRVFSALLQTTVNLASPARVGQGTTTDTLGSATWALPVPSGSSGREVWFQAFQIGRKSNVVATAVE